MMKNPFAINLEARRDYEHLINRQKGFIDEERQMKKYQTKSDFMENLFKEDLRK